MGKISEHISYEEAIHSDTASRLKIDNTPNDYQLDNMVAIANNVFEPIRNHFNVRIAINSFFRSRELNVAVGGSVVSQHERGEAMDIDAHRYGGVTNKEIFDYVKDNLAFDQLISEFPDDSGEPEWVHVSYKKQGNRKEILVSRRVGKKVTYEKFRP